jgi:prepilin-type N-terminal cleavage/methylation domain-containing protein
MKIRTLIIRRGVTLVELLVTISIIGVLVGLLLPALQSARESGRRMQCQNHLKQLALASLQHEQQHGFFPSGGWGWSWTGDADRGPGRGQPGSWLYSLLPYLEQGALYALPGDGNPQATTTDQTNGAATLVVRPVAVANCPSRRPAALFAIAGTSLRVVRSDYAGSAGTAYRDLWQFGWPSWDQGPGSIAEAESPVGQQRFRDQAAFFNGIMYAGSEVRAAHVRDGLSNTYLLGEKYCNPDEYINGQDPADNEHMYAGHNPDTLRWAGRPDQDIRGMRAGQSFGSAHPHGFQVSLCDGSVRSISYAIESRSDPANPGTHQRLSNRRDGFPIDLSSL